MGQEVIANGGGEAWDEYLHVIGRRDIAVGDGGFGLPAGGIEEEKERWRLSLFNSV